MSKFLNLSHFQSGTNEKSEIAKALVVRSVGIKDIHKEMLRLYDHKNFHLNLLLIIGIFIFR